MPLRTPPLPVPAHGVHPILLRGGLLLRHSQQIVVHLLATDHHRLEVAEVEVLGEDEVILRLTPCRHAHRRVPVSQRTHLARDLSEILGVRGEVANGQRVVVRHLVHAPGDLVLRLTPCRDRYTPADRAGSGVGPTELEDLEDVEGEENVAVDVAVVFALVLLRHRLEHSLHVGHPERVQAIRERERELAREGADDLDVVVAGCFDDGATVGEENGFEVEGALEQGHHAEPVHDLVDVVVLGINGEGRAYATLICCREENEQIRRIVVLRRKWDHRNGGVHEHVRNTVLAPVSEGGERHSLVEVLEAGTRRGDAEIRLLLAWHR